MESTTPLYDINTIMTMLPHRYPFLMIDRVEEIIMGTNPNSRIGRKFHCTKNVTVNEPFFPGHFPGMPVMPGVMVVEAMAQAAAIACYNVGESADFFLASIREAKFRRKVLPGDTLDIRGEIIRDGGTLIISRVVCTVRGQVVAEADVMAKVFNKGQ
jgi:3-hydroxyacyl-[acyl-carrier-protein] dehydratase